MGIPFSLFSSRGLCFDAFVFLEGGPGPKLGWIGRVSLFLRQLFSFFVWYNFGHPAATFQAGGTASKKVEYFRRAHERVDELLKIKDNSAPNGCESDT